MSTFRACSQWILPTLCKVLSSTNGVHVHCRVLDLYHSQTFLLTILSHPWLASSQCVSFPQVSIVPYLLFVIFPRPFCLNPIYPLTLFSVHPRFLSATSLGRKRGEAYRTPVHKPGKVRFWVPREEGGQNEQCHIHLCLLHLGCAENLIRSSQRPGMDTACRFPRNSRTLK